MADKTATYALNLEGNAKQTATDSAAALEKLRTSVAGGMQAVKEYSAALRSLRGASDEVKAAKDQLKAKIEAERSAVSAGNLELLKAGTSYEKLADQTKKAAAEQKRYQDQLKADQLKALAEEQKKLSEEQKRTTESVRAAGGPVSDLKTRFEELDKSLSTGAGAMALVAGAAIAAGAAVWGLAKGAFELGVAFTRWIVVSADAARSAFLMREAWTGSATNATHLGNQIDALAGKVPIARDKLNDMSGALVKALNNSRVSGTGIVDTFKAVAQASAAMGDEVGKKLQDIVERAKNTGRVRIDLFELQGAGVSRTDIARQLAKDLGVSTEAAVTALAQGRVKVNDGAKAIREVVEARFGEINAKKLLTLDAQVQTFKGNLQKLTKDVNLDPLLKGIQSFIKLFDTSTVSGSVLHTMITTIGNSIVSAFSDKNIAKGKELFERAELAGLKMLIAVYKIDNAIGSVFGKDWKSSLFMTGLEGAEKMMKGLAIEADRVSRLIDRITGAGSTDHKTRGTETSSSEGRKQGKDLGAGVAAGIRESAGLPAKATTEMATGIMAAFKSALQIHSPSKVFEDYGKQTAAGYRKGVEAEGPSTNRVVERMVVDRPKESGKAPAAAPAGKGGGRAAPVHIEVNINAGGGGAQELGAPQFLAQLTKAITDAVSNAGLPIQTEPST